MGEPSRGHALLPAPEYIRCEEATGGTETSKYPEEKKETSISKVAASEMERGQTVVRAQRGSDRIIDSVILAERFWESLPERVKAP